MKASAILVMAGNGSRFKKTMPKQFYRLSGIPIYLHTLEVFLKSNLFNEIILCCHLDFISRVKSETCNYQTVKVIPGGKTRQESVFEGINSCNKNCEIVLIHDAVRPFVSLQILENNLALAKKYQAVNTCIQSSDTIIETLDKKTIHKIPNRQNLMQGQTPQTFSYDLIRKAHQNSLNKNITNATDDCQLVLNLFHTIHICEGDKKNIKITTEFDLILAEQILKKPSSFIKIAPNNAKNKKYLLIGASGGIGNCIKKILEEEGHFVIPVSKKHSQYKMDLRDKNNIKATLALIFQKYGLVDGLINCAGVLHKSTLTNLSDEEIADLIQINFTGVVYCCKFAKIKSGGHIINVASSAHLKGRKNHSIYSSSKAALVNFTEALAEEKEDLFVNAVIPSRTNTYMRRSFFKNDNLNELLPPETVAIQIVELLKTQETARLVEIKL
jgi:ribitol-5-phosphate 2-dehydrogenase (NADP+) / D-ribitol-5-phosphate cytidylyltransferase